MSAQGTIARQREQNAVMAALLKRATGEPLDATDKEVLGEFAKGRALEQRLREQYDLGGAIEKALRNPSGSGASVSTHRALPSGAGRWAPQPLDRPLAKSRRERDEDAHEAEVAKRRAKVHADIYGGQS